MRTLYRSAPLALLLCAGLSACATGSPDVAEDPYAFTATSRPPQVRIVVRNMNFNDVRLFALEVGLCRFEFLSVYIQLARRLIEQLLHVTRGPITPCASGRHSAP